MPEKEMTKGQPMYTHHGKKREQGRHGTETEEPEMALQIRVISCPLFSADLQALSFRE